jgi:hypothetical protein
MPFAFCEPKLPRVGRGDKEEVGSTKPRIGTHGSFGRADLVDTAPTHPHRGDLKAVGQMHEIG